MSKGLESLFVSIFVAKYNIFPRADKGRSREKKKFAHAISEHYRDFEHAYVYWIWLLGSASYVITYFSFYSRLFTTWQADRTLLKTIVGAVTQQHSKLPH